MPAHGHGSLRSISVREKVDDSVEMTGLSKHPGKGTVTAMRSLNSFCLFPAVFTFPKATDAEISNSYSREGLELMEAADSLLGQWQPKVFLTLSSPQP